MAQTMTKKAQADAEEAEAIAKLRELLKPGDTVHTVLHHVSRSGMSRAISVVICRDGQPSDISWMVAQATGDKLSRNHDGIEMGGCGMDMGFALVYGLSVTLYGSGYNCLGEGSSEDYYRHHCPSNEHTNYRGERGGDDFSPTRIHTDGYALHHKWL